MPNIFIYISTVIFMFLSVIWSSAKWRDIFLKITFIVMTVFGFVLSLVNFGFLLNPFAK